MLNTVVTTSTLFALASALGRSPVAQAPVCKVDQCLSAINAHDVALSTVRGRIPVAGCSSYMAVTVSPCSVTKTIVNTISAPTTTKTWTAYTDVVSIVTSTYTPVVTIRVPAPRNFTSPISTGSPSRNVTSPGAAAPPARNATLSGPPGGPPAVNVTQPARPAVNVTEPARPAVNVTQPARPAVNVTEPARPVVNVTEPARVAVNASSPALLSNSSSAASNLTLQRRAPIDFSARVGLNAAPIVAAAQCTPKLITPSIVPSYASACSNAAQYTSACACAKFTANTVTAVQGTTTKSVIMTQQATVTVRSVVTNVKIFTKTVVGPVRFVSVTVGAGPTAGR